VWDIEWAVVLGRLGIQMSSLLLLLLPVWGIDLVVAVMGRLGIRLGLSWGIGLVLVIGIRMVLLSDIQLSSLMLWIGQHPENEK
jgi:hypothetical protein